MTTPVAVVLVGCLSVVGCSGGLGDRGGSGAAGGTGGSGATGGTQAGSCNPSDPTSGGTCDCPSVAADMVQLPLSCFCTPGSCASCPATIADFNLDQICATGATVSRVSGCGKVTFQTVGYGGTAPTFDVASNQLVGVTLYNDLSFGACGAFAYRFGDVLTDSCPSEAVVRCKLCGSLNIDPSCPDAT